MNLGIKQVRDKYIVVDMDNHTERSVKYDKEVNALRRIKLLTGFKQDWRLLEVTKIYNDSPNPRPTRPPEPIMASDVFKSVPEAETQEPQEPQVINEPYRELVDGEYYCDQCKAVHRKNSKIGKKHLGDGEKGG